MGLASGKPEATPIAIMLSAVYVTPAQQDAE